LKQIIKITFALPLLIGALRVQAQNTRFSMATDLSVQHSFKKEQRFTVIGQTTYLHIHLTPKDGFYASFAYYSNGKFKNNLTATAKSGSTTPSQISYVNNANMRLKEFSMGWKKYLFGNAMTDKGINIYASAGFGLMLGRVENRHTVAIDTALYDVPVLTGRANFKRLSIDPGIGVDRYIGADIYIYAEGRVWIPTDGFPSRYIYINDRAPWTGMASLGLRVMF
jgi:hypothetical protein